MPPLPADQDSRRESWSTVVNDTDAGTPGAVTVSSVGVTVSVLEFESQFGAERWARI